MAGESAKSAPCLRIAMHYAIAALGCIAFATVYAQFSHGVHSPFMTFMCMIPLVGGTLVALVLHVARHTVPPRASRQAWALCIASLTVASCLRGVFDIAGTSSPYLVVYLVAAAAFGLAAATFAVTKSRSRS